MEKHADTADISVLFFSLAVLIFWLYTCKLAKKPLRYKHCAKGNMQKALHCTAPIALCYWHCAKSNMLKILCQENCARSTVLNALC